MGNITTDLFCFGIGISYSSSSDADHCPEPSPVPTVACIPRTMHRYGLIWEVPHVVYVLRSVGMYPTGSQRRNSARNITTTTKFSHTDKQTLSRTGESYTMVTIHIRPVSAMGLLSCSLLTLRQHPSRSIPRICLFPVVSSMIEDFSDARVPRDLLMTLVVVVACQTSAGPNSYHLKSSPAPPLSHAIITAAEPLRKRGG